LSKLYATSLNKIDICNPGLVFIVISSREMRELVLMFLFLNFF
jgi:hypothetical protein